MKKIIFLTILILVSVSHVNSSQLVNRVVAQVNGETITLLELQARVKNFLGMFEDVNIDELPEAQLNQARQQVLDQMVNDILLRLEAEKYGLEVTDREIKNHINRIISENDLSEEEFENHLRGEGLTLDAYKRQTRDSILRQRILSMMVRRKVLVTPDEIESYYKENISQFQEDKKVHLKVIIMPDLEKAARIREQISRGELSFDKAAADFSQGPNPAQGGDLGVVDWKRLAPEWRQELDNLQQGDLSEVFEVREAGAVLKVVEMRSGGAVPLSEVEEQIRERLFNAKLDQRFEDYIKGLQEKAVIDIRL